MNFKYEIGHYGNEDQDKRGPKQKFQPAIRYFFSDSENNNSTDG